MRAEERMGENADGAVQSVIFNGFDLQMSAQQTASGKCGREDLTERSCVAQRRLKGWGVGYQRNAAGVCALVLAVNVACSKGHYREIVETLRILV